MELKVLVLQANVHKLNFYNFIIEKDYDSKKKKMEEYNKNENNIIPFNEVQERTKKDREARLIKKYASM